jgi:hypothetical protein
LDWFPDSVSFYWLFFQVSAKSLETGVWGAYQNVIINLDQITDEDYRKKVLVHIHNRNNFIFPILGFLGNYMFDLQMFKKKILWNCKIFGFLAKKISTDHQRAYSSFGFNDSLDHLPQITRML